MVNTRGSRQSFGASEAVPSDVAVSSELNGSNKVTHPLDQDEPTSPSRHAKKRRTGSGGEAVAISSNETPAADESLAQLAQNVASTDSENPANGDLSQNENQQSHTSLPGAPESTAATGIVQDPLGPDVAQVISNIMDHAERVEEQCALGMQGDSKDMLYPKANSHLKEQSLPILDNLASQILSLLSQSTFQEITSIVSEPDSENGQAYSTMRSLFDHTKKVYSAKGPFLSPSELDLTEPNQVDIIRKVNMASFVSSIFGSQEVGFSELNDNFLDIFVPEGSRLLKVQGALFLELKTQAYIAAMNTKERSRTELLHELFPDDLEQQLLSRRPGTTQLAPSESDFIQRAHSRRDILISAVNEPDVTETLPQKYQWEAFLRDLSSYVSKNFEAISHQQTKKPNKGRPATTNGDTQESKAAPLDTQFSVAPNASEPAVPERKTSHKDLVARAARAAQIALQGQRARQNARAANAGQQQPQTPQQPQPQQPSHQPNIPQQPPQQQHQFIQAHPQPAPPAPHTLPPGPQQHTFHQNPSTPSYPPQPTQITFHQTPIHFQQYTPPSAPSSTGARADAAAATYGYMPGVPHYSQSQPTQVLYEQARLVTSAKSTSSNRRTGLPSQRRPWTTEEENALMAGLDRVKGPHWSQILAMFGPGGTINESLKDRNQVQLKDKARNLKLFFLKSGIEVPYYLKFVTGELKTRAPAQAAKHEARERERRRGEEDKAHVEGIEGMMALAGAHASSISPGPAPDSIPPVPGLPQSVDQQQTQEQAAEQALIQSLGQGVKQEEFRFENHHIDPSLQNPM